jgi:hypothetical protein
MDLELIKNIVHRNVSTNITIDRGVLISITPDIHDIGYSRQYMEPLIHRASK